MTLNLARLGPFVLEELIGSGGMGEVWRGMHQARATARTSLENARR
jgi:hypothetical protein